ncbi:hypothetical protein BD779DRAFT_1678397 [Infundibulicybe gibba]|nr:hypothetical protein BD779DRAFT_1678397 [Infundibulicybe gibba]
MSELVGGRFLIKPVTRKDLDGIGGIITRHGPGEPLTLYSDNLVDQQDWEVNKVDGPEDLYTLTPFFPPKDDGFSWEGKNPTPLSSVFLGKPRHFILTQVKDAGPLVYQIQPVITELVGADYYVGHDAELKKVQYVAYPVVPEEPEGPMWRFIPILLK